MVGLVIISHSRKIAEGIQELIEDMLIKPIPLVVVGGTFDGRLGTDPEKILTAIQEVYSPDGVLVLYDFGSSLLSAEAAVALLPQPQQQDIIIFHTPLIDGSLNAAMEISFNKSMVDITRNLQSVNQLYGQG